MALKETLTQKAGPLPVYGWILLISVGIIGVWYWKSRSSSNTSSTDTSTPNDMGGDNVGDYASGIIGADYDLANQLGETGSIIATNTNATSANTTATNANTAAEKENTSVQPGSKKFAVVDYNHSIYELGADSTGVHLTPAMYKQTGVDHPIMTKNPVVDFRGTVFTLGASYDPYEGIAPAGKPARLTPAQYATWRKRHHNMRATVLAPNASVNVAPSKVKG